MANPNFPNNPGYNLYVGARYVPLFSNPIEWDSTKTYEPLTIVTHQGNSYTSKTFVPAGTQITNTTYWALTGNYNAQIEQYRQEVEQLSNEISNLRYFTNVKEYGAKGDGSTDDSDAIISAINDTMGTVFFPPGTYVVSKTLNLPQSKHTNLMLSNAIIKQSVALSPMIKVASDDGDNYPQSITGDGVIDMDSLGGIGILITDNGGYAILEDIQVRNCSNGVGIQIGENNDTSLQCHLDNVKIYGTDSRFDGIGMSVKALDCTFDNMYIYLCKTALEIERGGHYFGSLKIWGHTYTSYTNSEFKATTGINIVGGSCMFGFLYLDSIYNGFITNGYDQFIDNLYYTSDITQTFNPAIVANIINRKTVEKIVINKAILYSPRSYTVKTFFINNNSNSVNSVINRYNTITSQINSNTKYEVRDDCFNTSIQNITKQIVPSRPATANRYYLLGYIKNGGGIIDLKLTQKAALYFEIRIRVANSQPITIINKNLVHPSSVSDKHLYYGETVSYDGNEWIPIYFKFDANTNYALLSVSSEVYGETGFYANIVTTYDDLPYLETSSGLTEIPLETE